MDVYMGLHAKLRKLGLKNKIDYELREGGVSISIETRDEPKIIALLAAIGIPTEYETKTLPWGTFTSLVVKQNRPCVPIRRHLLRGLQCSHGSLLSGYRR